MVITKKDVERMLDGSMAASNPTIQEAIDFTTRASEYDFAGILASAYFVPHVAEIAHSKGRKIVSVVDYPMGGANNEIRLVSARAAFANGADSLDVSMNISAFMAGDYQRVKDEIKPFLDLAGDRLIKIIYFATLLTPDQQLKAAELCIDCGVQYLKTNTGHGSISKPEEVKLIKDHFGQAIKVMVSGGVRTGEDARKMIMAGCDRIATSAPFRILDTFVEEGRPQE